MPKFNGVEISEEQLAEAGYTRNSSTVHKMPVKPKFGRVKPKIGDDYYFIDGRFTSTPSRSVWSDDYIDKCGWLLGNAYLTREAAELAIKRQQAKMRVIDKLAELKELDWDDGTHLKYYLCVNDRSNLSSNCIHKNQPMEKELYSTKNAVEWVAEHMAEDVKLMLTGDRKSVV